MILKQTQIGNLITKISTWNPAKEKPNDILNYIDIGSVDKDEKKIVNYSSYLGINAPSRARQLVKENDVIVSTVRPNLNTIAQIPQELDGATASTGFCILRANPEKLHHRYLFHWVKTNNFITLMTNLAIGANYPAVSDSIIKTSQIPLPPLEEQKRIAHILDLAAGLQAKRRQAIARLDTLLQSTFLEMFGDPVTNPKGWEVRSINEYLEFLTSGSRGWAQYYSTQGTLFLRIQNIGHDELRLDDCVYVKAPDSAEKLRTTVKAGDLLLSVTADLGRTAVIPDNFPPANINQHIAVLRLKGINSEYVSSFLSSPAGKIQFEKLNKGGVKAGLNFNDIKSLVILVPPMDLQKRFAIYKNKVMQHILLLKKSNLALDTLFASLQQRAFSGRL